MIPGCLMNNIDRLPEMAWFSARPLLPRPARILWVCSTSLSSVYVDSAVCQPKMVHYQSHQQHRYPQCLQWNHIWDPKNPEKIAQKNLKTMSWWWLTDWGPRVTMVVGLDLDTNRHGIPIPQGWITPTTRNTPPLDYTPQDAPRGNFVVICEMTNIISPNAASWQAPLIGSYPRTNQIRASHNPEKKTVLYYVILFYTLSCRLVPMESIRDTSSTRY